MDGITENTLSTLVDIIVALGVGFLMIVMIGIWYLGTKSGKKK